MLRKWRKGMLSLFKLEGIAGADSLRLQFKTHFLEDENEYPEAFC